MKSNDKDYRIRAELVRTKTLFKRRTQWYIRAVWVHNGKTAWHSETYNNRKDAINLAEAVSTDSTYWVAYNV